MGKITGVVFDLDGTLVDSDQMIVDSFQYAIDPYNVKIDFSDVDRLRALTSLQLFQELVGADHAQNALARHDQYCAQRADSAPLFDGMIEILEELCKRDIKLAVWTGRGTTSARNILKSNGVLQYFPVVVGNCLVEQNKPHPEGLVKVAQALGEAEKNLLMVGDHFHDGEGADRAGCSFVMVDFREHGKLDPLAKEKASCGTISSPALLLENLLERI